MDKKMLLMGLAGLVLVLMLLSLGCVCAYYIAKAYDSHTKELDVRRSIEQPVPHREGVDCGSRHGDSSLQ